jgi:hypothetical protein
MDALRSRAVGKAPAGVKEKMSATGNHLPASAHRSPLIPEVGMQDTVGIPMTATRKIGFYSGKRRLMTYLRRSVDDEVEAGDLAGGRTRRVFTHHVEGRVAVAEV